MLMDRRLLSETDAAYRALETRWKLLGFRYTSGWYNGRYACDERGEFRCQLPHFRRQRGKSL